MVFDVSSDNFDDSVAPTWTVAAILGFSDPVLLIVPIFLNVSFSYLLV